MQIDLPADVIAKANSLANEGEDAATVLAKGLESLEWERQEVAAVMEGIADHEAGRSRLYEEFADEIMREHGIRREQ